MTYTESDPETCNAGSRMFDPERENAARRHKKPQPAITESDSVLWRVRDYFTPPELLTERPASIPELGAYAHRGDWTRQAYGPIRTGGIWWWRLVGFPQTLRRRIGEWVWQRPGRAVTVIALVKLLSLTTPGGYVVERLIKPVVHATLWLFL